MLEDTRPDRMKTLAERLLTLTEARRISWSETNSSHQFSYSTPSTSVLIRNKDGDDEHPYVLTVFDGGGSAVDSLSSRYVPRGEEGPDSNDTLERLYVLARQSASKIDEVLDVLFTELPPT